MASEPKVIKSNNTPSNYFPYKLNIAHTEFSPIKRKFEPIHEREC